MFFHQTWKISEYYLYWRLEWTIMIHWWTFLSCLKTIQKGKENFVDNFCCQLNSLYHGFYFRKFLNIISDVGNNYFQHTDIASSLQNRPNDFCKQIFLHFSYGFWSWNRRIHNTILFLDHSVWPVDLWRRNVPVGGLCRCYFLDCIRVFFDLAWHRPLCSNQEAREIWKCDDPHEVYLLGSTCMGSCPQLLLTTFIWAFQCKVLQWGLPVHHWLELSESLRNHSWNSDDCSTIPCAVIFKLVCVHWQLWQEEGWIWKVHGFQLSAWDVFCQLCSRTYVCDILASMVYAPASWAFRCWITKRAATATFLFHVVCHC